MTNENVKRYKTLLEIKKKCKLNNLAFSLSEKYITTSVKLILGAYIIMIMWILFTSTILFLLIYGFYISVDLWLLYFIWFIKVWYTI